MNLFTAIFGASIADDPIVAAIEAAEAGAPGAPWSPLPTIAVGGLTALGFARTDETLLVASHNGQSVIDAATGTQLYRNRDADGLDTAVLKGTRLDSPADERFDMAGLYGGALKSITDDGWAVATIAVGSSVACILHPPGASIFNLKPAVAASGKDTRFHLLARETEEVRVFGFSWTGRSLVLATPSDLRIWTRPAPLTLS